MPPKGTSVTVPTRAVQNTQQGTSVYVVQADKTVKLVKIKAGQTSGDYTAVDEGVQVGDMVVTDGQLQLSPGSKVRIQKSNDKDKFGSGVTAAGGGGLDSSSTPGAPTDNGGVVVLLVAQAAELRIAAAHLLQALLRLRKSRARRWWHPRCFEQSSRSIPRGFGTEPNSGQHDQGADKRQYP